MFKWGLWSLLTVTVEAWLFFTTPGLISESAQRQRGSVALALTVATRLDPKDQDTHATQWVPYSFSSG